MINHLLGEISIQSFVESVWCELESEADAVIYLAGTRLHLNEYIIYFFSSKKICFMMWPEADMPSMAQEEVIEKFNPFLKEIEEIAINYKASEMNLSHLSYGDKMKEVFPGYSGDLIDLFQKRPTKSINSVQIK